jgi:putative flippase GtrA
MHEDGQRWLARFARRVLLFVLGGVLSYTLNVCIFDLLTGGLHWPRLVAQLLGVPVRIGGGAGWPPSMAYAVSLSVVTLTGFLWSYHVNFPTREAWHRCAPRYVVTFVVCAAANYAIVQTLLASFPARERIVILAGMAAGAAGKFLLYSLWVFPEGKPSCAKVGA